MTHILTHLTLLTFNSNRMTKTMLRNEDGKANSVLNKEGLVVVEGGYQIDRNKDRNIVEIGVCQNNFA